MTMLKVVGTAVLAVLPLAYANEGYAGSQNKPASPLAKTTMLAPGVTLTISARHSTYPRKALIPITLTVRNGSSGDYTLRGGAPHISAEVLNRQGQQVDPGVLGSPMPRGGALPPVVLHPGATRTVRMDVVLLGPFVAPVVGISRLSTELRFRLGPEDPPRVTVSPLPHLGVSVQPPAGAVGPMRYKGWLFCNSAFGQVGAAYLDHWVKVPTLSFTAYIPSACVGSIQWHGAVGWPGHSIAPFVYVEGPSSAA